MDKELQVFKDEVVEITETASFVEVTDQGTYEMAEVIGKNISDKIKDIKKFFDVRKKEANKVHKRVCADEKDSLAPYQVVFNDIKVKMLAYEEEQAKIRREEERIARAKFDKEQKEKREKQEKERQKLEKENAKKVAAGEVVAEIIEEEEEEISAEDIYIPPTIEKKGQNRVTWSAEVISVQDFYRGIITSGRWDLIEPNQSALNAAAKEMKAESDIPGVKFVSKTTKVL
ncbi:hypothetical protein KAR91_69690 [Candidatus Pacearchaeota archaeon]|nr:hypothetical protein [Candidatus Pacearchaeota archaeon]